MQLNNTSENLNSLKTLEAQSTAQELKSILKNKTEAKENLGGVFSLLAKQERKNLLALNNLNNKDIKI